MYKSQASLKNVLIFKLNYLAVDDDEEEDSRNHRGMSSRRKQEYPFRFPK